MPADAMRWMDASAGRAMGGGGTDVGGLYVGGLLWVDGIATYPCPDKHLDVFDVVRKAPLEYEDLLNRVFKDDVNTKPAAARNPTPPYPPSQVW